MTVADAPVLEVDGRPVSALDRRVLSRLAAGHVDRWLRARRWFGGKGRLAGDVRVRDLVPLFRDDPPSAVARIVVGAGGIPATYQLPLALRSDAPEGADPLARVRAGAEEAVLFDALEDAGFRDRLGRAFDEGATFSGDGSRWVVSPLDDVGRRAIPAGSPSRVSRAEQSNTSVLYGSAAILKIFRRVEPGENPDAEIGRFLATRTSFRNVPRLYGTIRFEDADGTTSVAGQLQAFVAGSRDGWGYALERLRDDLAGRRQPSFETDARRLGELTRGLHEALASDRSDPDFAPEPATTADVAAWAAAVRSQAERAFDLLSRRAGEEADISRKRTSIGDTVDRLYARVGSDTGARIRHHGDYHLGQVLRTADGDFMIIDFEGEPARPLEERRRRHSPLRDVAGMLRSFEYAAGCVLREGTEAASEAVDWCRRVRKAFLDGYRAGRVTAVLPRDAAAFEALLDLFELEKVLYEIAYELDNRPDWVAIPLDGLRTLLGRAASS